MSVIEFLLKNPTIPIIGVGTIIAFFSLRSQRHLTQAKHTLDFDKDFKEKRWVNLLNAAAIFRSLSHEALYELGKSGKMVPDETDPFTAIADALNTWEGVAIGFRNKVYSEKLLFEAYGTTVVKLYLGTTPFIRARQVANPRLFYNFERLGLRWAAKLAVPLKLQKELDEAKRVADSVKKYERGLLEKEIRLAVLEESSVERSFSDSSP